MACILEELENTLKKQLGNTKNSKEFKDGAAKAKERVAELSTLLNEVADMKKVMKGQVNTEADKDSKENKEIVHISSDAKGLGAALTNPTELSKKKGNIEQDYSITYKDKDYISVEAAYQANKVDETKTKPNKSESANYNLMVELITEKLHTYPKLVSAITKLGGLGYLAKAVHQPTKQNTVWETGGKDWFVDALKEAYTVANLPGTVKFKVKGFNGYVSIKNTGGKGSVEGDAKDIAMREVADGFVGEISNGRLNNSSTGTSYNALKDNVSGPTSAGSITYHGAAEPSTVMLARNGSFRGKPLNSETKEAIEYYFQEGASFVVGDMPGVDSQFINYLDEIGASYKIYHTGNNPRIVKEDIKYQKGIKDSYKQEADIIVPTETFQKNVNRKIECKE